MRKVYFFLLFVFALFLSSCNETTPSTPTTQPTTSTETTSSAPTTSSTSTSSSIVQKPVIIRETGQGFDTIQEAINAASAGQHIDVSAGTYEEHITIDKKLYLIGADRNTTIINGGGTGNIVTLSSGADGSLITGFKIMNGSTAIYSPDTVAITIERNIVKQNVSGIDLAYASSNLIITGSLIEDHTANGLSLHRSVATPLISECIFQNNYDGMSISSINPKIVKCEARNNTRYGISCWGTANPDIGGGAQGGIGQNKIRGNASWDLSNQTTNAIKAENNYWDHTTATDIDTNDIYDDDENASYGAVDFDPFLTTTSLISLRTKSRLLHISPLFRNLFRSLFKGDLPISAIYLSCSFEPRLRFTYEELQRGERYPLFDEQYYPPLRMRTKR